MFAEVYQEKTIQYFADKSDYPFYFTDQLYSVVEELRHALPASIAISIYPDATLKSNGLPTGISCSAKTKDTFLLPFILRDPGCGFLMFKLSTSQLASTWQENLGNQLSNLEKLKTFQTIKQNILNQYSIEDLATNGLQTLNINNEINAFRNNHFKISNTINFTNQERHYLTNDFMNLTNTIEIRKISQILEPDLLQKFDITENDYIGFIHTGSLFFPKLLGARFLNKICEYAHLNKLFSLDEIKKGILGISLDSNLGEAYSNYLSAAMNYALVSRYSIFQVVKKIIQHTTHGEVSLLDDNVHAGIFTKQVDIEEQTFITRGVQQIAKEKLSLVAGQRESIAALVTADDKSEQFNNLIGHGTGYLVRNDINYHTRFTEQSVQKHLTFAHNTFYNTMPNYNECIAHTYNLESALAFYKKINLAKTIALLSPFINIQSQWLKASA